MSTGLALVLAINLPFLLVPPFCLRRLASIVAFANGAHFCPLGAIELSNRSSSPDHILTDRSHNRSQIGESIGCFSKSCLDLLIVRGNCDLSHVVMQKRDGLAVLHPF